MSIRVIACLLFVIAFSVYAWRNWFASLCASVVLMAFLQHPDMPKSIGGIQGLNPWNILMANVFLAWWTQRPMTGYSWDMPNGVFRLLIGFVVIMLWGLSRILMDPKNLEDYSPLSAISEYGINNTKWLLVCVIFYDTCRTRRQVMIGIYSIVALYVLLAIQVIRWVPLRFAVSGGDDFSWIAYKLIQNEVGYNRVTISMVFGGASWAVICLLPLFETKNARLILLACAGAIFLGQALTGGRTGYFSWVAVGCFICWVRWRKLLLLIPVFIACALAFLPGVRDRLLHGIGTNEGGQTTQTDAAVATSGRTVIWPEVIRMIGESPLYGYGRLAMRRTGLTEWLLREKDEDFGHPHNAYLEIMFDNGIIGFAVVIPLMFILLRRAYQVLKDKSDPFYTAVGGMAFAFIVALLIGSLAGQTFYPRESAVGMWAIIGIALRVSVERERVLEYGGNLFDEPGEHISVASSAEFADDDFQRA